MEKMAGKMKDLRTELEKAIVEEIGNFSDEEVKMEHKLADDLGLDELDVSEIVIEIEDQFNVDLEMSLYDCMIQNEEITVKDMVDRFEKAITEQG